MNLLPWQFQEINEKYLITNEAGSFFFCSEKSFKNLINKNIDSIFESFLVDKNFLYKQENDKAWNNYIYNLYKRKKINNSFNYLILVPTLRCNLNCSYCQVSRVNENKSGFDWNDEILYNFEKFISNQDTEFIGDPVARYYGMRQDDIVEITRNSKTNGEHKVYRLVVGTPPLDLT